MQIDAQRVRPPKPALPPRIMWGAFIRGAQYGLPDWPGSAPTPSAYDHFVEGTGKAPGIATMGGSFLSSSGVVLRFSTTQADRIRAAGAIPLVTWGPQKSGDNPNLGTYTNAMFRDDASLDSNWLDPADHTKGTLGAYIDRFAADCAAWGHPFFLRFAWEQNHDLARGQKALWPWNDGANQNAAGSCKRMWRTVWTRFNRVCPAATWLFCVDNIGLLPLSQLWPGPAYVDWVGADGYNKGSSWQPFAKVFGQVYADLRAFAPGKPFMAAEVGTCSNVSASSAGAKAAWVTEMLAALPAEFPAIEAVVYFNSASYPTGANPVNLEHVLAGGAPPMSAFAAGIASPYFAANEFGALAPGKIRPL